MIYPPAPPTSLPMVSPANAQLHRAVRHQHDGDFDRTGLDHDHDHEHVCGCGGDHSDFESEEEDENITLTQEYAWSDGMVRATRKHMEEMDSRARGLPAASASSSADGYESFENTNNKKKRKIPLSGPLSSSGLDYLDSVVGTRSGDTSHEHLDQQYTSSSVGAALHDREAVTSALRGRSGRGSMYMANDRRFVGSSGNSGGTYSSGTYGRNRREWIQTGAMTRGNRIVAGA